MQAVQTRVVENEELGALRVIPWLGEKAKLVLSLLAEQAIFYDALYIIGVSATGLSQKPAFDLPNHIASVIMALAPEIILPGAITQIGLYKKTNPTKRVALIVLCIIFGFLTATTLASFIWNFEDVIGPFILLLRAGSGIGYTIVSHIKTSDKRILLTEEEADEKTTTKIEQLTRTMQADFKRQTEQLSASFTSRINQLTNQIETLTAQALVPNPAQIFIPDDSKTVQNPEQNSIQTQGENGQDLLPKVLEILRENSAISDQDLAQILGQISTENARILRLKSEQILRQFSSPKPTSFPAQNRPVFQPKTDENLEGNLGQNQANSLLKTAQEREGKGGQLLVEEVLPTYSSSPASRPNTSPLVEEDKTVQSTSQAGEDAKEKREIGYTVEDILALTQFIQLEKSGSVRKRLLTKALDRGVLQQKTTGKIAKTAVEKWLKTVAVSG